jgi:hypothetical protein
VRAFTASYKSITTSLLGWEQQISRLPWAGGSSGSGWYSTLPEIKPLSQVWQTPVRHDQRTGTSQASAKSRRLENFAFQHTLRPLRTNDTRGPEPTGPSGGCVGIQLVNHDGTVHASMAAQVSLAITIDIKFSDNDVARHWTLPDARVDGFAAPVDIAWQTDVNGQKCCHFSSRPFASVPQTVRSTGKNFSNAALPGMSGVSNFSLFEPQTFRDEDAVQSVEEELHQQCE